MNQKILPTIFTLLLTGALLRAANDPAAPACRLGLSSPLDYQVIQRTTQAEGRLIISGSILTTNKSNLPLDALEVRVTGNSAAGELPGRWQPLPFDARVAAFRRELAVPAGGWYRVEVRVLNKGVEVAVATVEHVGVGEIFVIAGQSNSANYGEEKQTNQTGLVSAFDGAAWQLAGDPEPGAAGKGGSFMPPFGDELARQFKVPVGIVAMGIGSTSVREWLPPGTRLAVLPTVTRNVVTVGPGQWEAAGKIFTNFTGRMKLFGTNGFRAVLWHQGESDGNQTPADRTLPGHLYHDYLAQLIRDSRQEIGWEAPWFVAQVSYHYPNDVASPEIRAAQKALWEEGIGLEGPDTDTLTGNLREKNGTGIHLSAAGLREHARLWVAKVAPWLDTRLKKDAARAK